MTFFCLVAKKSADKKNRFVQNYAMFAVRNPVLRRYILTNEVPDLMYHLLVLLQDQGLDLGEVIDNLKNRH